MSQYIQFFVKSPKGEFLPIGNFSRVCSIFSAFEEFCPFDVPYEKVASVTIKDLSCIRKGFKDKIEEIDHEILNIEKMITVIAGCNNSIEDKLNEIRDLNSEIEEWTKTKKELQSSESYIASLMEIIDSVSWEDKYDEDKYLYCGIEVGEKPEEVEG